MALAAVVSFLLGLVAAGGRGSRQAEPLPVRPPADLTEPVHITGAATAPPAPVAIGGVDFAEVASRINAAVVNVDNASRGDGDRNRTFPPRYRRELGDDSSAPREGSGSGFIIDATGYILTNYHVVEGADRLTVTTGDGRSYQARVVGIDPAIDVALLDIDAPRPLPAAPLGRSATLRVGEWVCAIGNPLGYVHSVTVGVVSFLGRKVFDPSLDSLIQTDAAITFGNSGGPLINSRGEVVGMTTAISALASNIGFAIPIDQIVEMLPQLQENGRVARGYLGVGLTTLTPALHQALGTVPSAGALVQDVTAGTPADRAGLRAYDVIVGADGHAIASDEDLIRYISARMPGTVSSFDLWREGQRQTMAIKLTERPVDQISRGDAVTPGVRPVSGQEQGPLGLTVRALDQATATRLRIPESIQGVLVSRVDPAGPARQARIAESHVIVEINRTPIRSVADFHNAVARLQPGVAAAVLVYDRQSGHVILTVVPDASR
ncbi:MAG: trypsin-like peptidase domain-containing protein [Vicinamibacterales bacterium]